MLLKIFLTVYRTIVRITIGKSQALYSSDGNRKERNNSGLLSIGAIRMDLPQHPVALHGMMTRSSRQLSSTLQVCTYFILQWKFDFFGTYTISLSASRNWELLERHLEYLSRLLMKPNHRNTFQYHHHVLHQWDEFHPWKI